jgi:hypothetical protein
MAGVPWPTGNLSRPRSNVIRAKTATAKMIKPAAILILNLLLAMN